MDGFTQRLLEVVDRFATARVVLYGDLVLDRFVLGTPKRISREAPVIILRFEGQRDVPGGGGNALANLGALGVDVVPVGAVGDDEPGEALLAALAKRGIETSTVLRVPGYHTPTKVRVLGGGGSSLKHQMARYDIEDVLSDGAFRDEFVGRLESAARGAAAVAVSDYGYGAVSGDAIGRLAAVDHRWVCLDSRYRIGSFAGVDGATPNLQELEASAGRPLRSDVDVVAAAEELRRRLGARFILATRGNRGMTLVVDGEAATQIPVFGTDEVADVTGAGDTVLAVLTAALAAGATPLEAAHLANYAGGLVVMKLGTATVTADEIRSALHRESGRGRGDVHSEGP